MGGFESDSKFKNEKGIDETIESPKKNDEIHKQTLGYLQRL